MDRYNISRTPVEERVYVETQQPEKRTRTSGLNAFQKELFQMTGGKSMFGLRALQQMQNNNFFEASWVQDRQREQWERDTTYQLSVAGIIPPYQDRYLRQPIDTAPAVTSNSRILYVEEDIKYTTELIRNALLPEPPGSSTNPKEEP